MKQIPGVTDADTTLRSGKPEVSLDIDRARAADLGVSVMDIEQALNTSLPDRSLPPSMPDDEQYDVRVRAQEQFRGTHRRLQQDDRPFYQQTQFSRA